PPPPTTTSAPPTTTAPTGDKTAPSTPGGLSVSNVTTSSLRLNWGASTDNVGVTGYDAFLNGAQVGTVSVLYGDFIGLACGSTYYNCTMDGTNSTVCYYAYGGLNVWVVVDGITSNVILW